MGHAKEQPRFSDPTDYEDDFHLWSYEQAELVRQKRFTELDLPNLVEELESMGSEQRFALESSYRLILSHLLKWEFQPQLRSRSWRNTIQRERANVARRERRNPSLGARAKSIVEEMYVEARDEASDQTGLPASAFPPELPYDLDHVRDRGWFPGGDAGELISDVS